jgi:Putative peptidoglycan binding domain/Caspase domain
MTRGHLTVLLGLSIACWNIDSARSEPLRIALVVSNGQYASMPPLVRCGASAATVRDALRKKGFEVMERSDLGRGEFDSAIGALARRSAASPPAFAALYYCGYALEFNGRSFVLPTSATIARDYDVLSQGIISKSLVDSLSRNTESGGFVVLDAFQTPSASAATGLARLVEQVPPSHFAVIGASNEGPGDGPTVASLALRDQAVDGEAGLETFVGGMRRQLAKDTGVAAYVIAATARPAPPPSAPPPAERRDAPPSPPPAASAPPAPAPVQPAPPPEPSTVASPAPPPPRQVMADEDQMSDQDRRLVQVKLATLGYYGGRIDGTFGPETRAAIRRYQFEIKAELTGRLTAEQATRLVNSVR